MLLLLLLAALPLVQPYGVPLTCDCRLQTDPPGVFPGWMSQYQCPQSCRCKVPRQGGCCQYGVWEDFQFRVPQINYQTQVKSMRYTLCESQQNSFCHRYAPGQSNACFVAGPQELSMMSNQYGSGQYQFGPNARIYIHCCSERSQCNAQLWNSGNQCNNNNRNRGFRGNYFCDRNLYRPRQRCYYYDQNCRNNWWQGFYGRCQRLNSNQLDMGSLPCYRGQGVFSGGCNRQPVCPSVPQNYNSGCNFDECNYYGPQCDSGSGGGGGGFGGGGFGGMFGGGGGGGGLY